MLNCTGHAKMRELIAICTEFAIDLTGQASCTDSINAFLAKLNNSLSGVAVALWNYVPESEILQIAYHVGLTEEYVSQGNQGARLEFFKAATPVYKVFKAQRPTKLEGLSNLDSPLQSFARHLGYDAIFLAPITCGTERIGVLVFYEPMVRTFEADDLLSWVTFVSQQFAIAYYQQQLRAQLKASLQERRRADAYKEEFLSMVSHELRTPLSVIKGNVEMLEDGIFGELQVRQMEALGKVGKAIRNMEKVVGDLVDLAALKAGRLSIHREPTDYRKLITEVLGMVHVLCQGKNLDLVAGPMLDATLNIDPTRIQQVLLNLLQNAIKFTKEGRISVSMSITDTGMLRTEVRDTGGGIDPNYKERIFEPFFRIDNGSVRQTSGIGLGLSLVAFIIQAHGGDYGVRNIEGGAIFWFDLPIGP